MAARALLATAGAVAAFLAFAAPAQADPVPAPNDPTDSSFLNALNNACISSATFAGSLNVWAISARNTSR